MGNKSILAPHDISCSYSIKITLRTRTRLCSEREPTTGLALALDLVLAQVGLGKSARLGLIPGRPRERTQSEPPIPALPVSSFIFGLLLFYARRAHACISFIAFAFAFVMPYKRRVY